MFTLLTPEEVPVRKGVLSTSHGILKTPFFMPDATRASVRGTEKKHIEQTGIEAMVVNTYHLFLQPGTNLVRKSGGIHAFMHWNKPLLSDSGGYQVYSLIHKNPLMGRVTEDGVEFKSVFDGSKHFLTPERAIQIQFDLGVDMMVCLDDPRPNDAPENEIASAVSRTLRWADRCKAEYNRIIQEKNFSATEKPLLFGVVQGGKIHDLRTKCIEGLVKVGFDGYGFGARHVDENGLFLEDIVRHTAKLIPRESLRFALGIGTPGDIIRCVRLGWDMFDCVIPTREGRHGRFFVAKENFSDVLQSMLTKDASADDTFSDFYTTHNINNTRFREDFSPLDTTCDCIGCIQHTRAYLHHLFRIQDPLGSQLLSIHNLRFYARLMHTIQSATTPFRPKS